MTDIDSIFRSSDFRDGMDLLKKACKLFQEENGKSYSLEETAMWMYFYIRCCTGEEEHKDDTMVVLLNMLVPLHDGNRSLMRCDFAGIIRDRNDLIIANLRQAKREKLVTETEYISLYGSRSSFLSDWTVVKYACYRDFMYWYTAKVSDDYEKYYRRGLIRYIDTHDDGKEIPPRGGAIGSWKSDLSSVMNVFDTSQEDIKRYAYNFLDRYTPGEIKEELDKYVIGQEDAKKLLASAIYNQYIRAANPEKNIQKYNVLIIGPSGSGKTELVRRVKEIVDVPVILEDVSGIVATPFKGRNKEELLRHLISEAGDDIKRAERGIIFCDEFDKLCHTNFSRGHDHNDQLMGQFLGMMEGAVINTSQRAGKKSDEDDYVIDTKNIMFVCMGAFEGLEDVVLKDIAEDEGSKKENSFGITPKIPEGRVMHSEDVMLTHLVDYGMKPELAGRLCNLAVLDAIDKDLLIKIMKEAKDSPIRRIQKELELDDQIELKFEDEALEALADMAVAKGTGVRALNGILHEALENVLYEAPSMPKGTVILVTREMIERGK